MRIAVRLALAGWCFAVGVSAAAVNGQDVPQGVNYKRATSLVNAKAKTSLEQALSSTSAPEGFLSQMITVGPVLWNDLAANHEELSKDSKPVTMVLSIGETLQAQGRAFPTQEQRERFWKLVMSKYPGLRKGAVRPARPNEISFYWATIPFDIEEPFFAIDTPDGVFISNLRYEGAKATLFWLDRVDDLKKLRK